MPPARRNLARAELGPWWWQAIVAVDLHVAPPSELDLLIAQPVSLFDAHLDRVLHRDSNLQGKGCNHFEQEQPCVVQLRHGCAR